MYSTICIYPNELYMSNKINVCMKLTWHALHVNTYTEIATTVSSNKMYGNETNVSQLEMGSRSTQAIR